MHLVPVHDVAPSVLIIGGAGYVGSRLAAALPTLGYRVTTLDMQPACGPGPHIRRRYQAMQADELAAYDWVLWFAGHSSVRIATGDPMGAVRNNMADLFEFQGRLRHGQGFIYASSASVYTMPRPELCTEEFRPRDLLNVYDQTKCWFDELMLRSGGRYWGLRLGTVAGASPALREDTVFNAMTLSAARHGGISVRNEDIYRGILGLPDLLRAIDTIVSRPVPPGLYNLASFHSTVGDLAHAIADRLGARVEVQPPTSGYNFRMSCAKFERAGPFRFTDTIDSLLKDLLPAHVPAAMAV